MRLKTCGMLWITGLICANDAVNKFAPVFRNGCLWLPKNTVFQLFLHLVSVTWPVGHVTYWLERAISRQVDIPLTQLAPTYRFEEWRTTRARFKSSRLASQARRRVERTS